MLTGSVKALQTRKLISISLSAKCNMTINLNNRREKQRNATASSGCSVGVKIEYASQHAMTEAQQYFSPPSCSPQPLYFGYDSLT